MRLYHAARFGRILDTPSRPVNRMIWIKDRGAGCRLGAARAGGRLHKMVAPLVGKCLLYV